MNIREVFQCPVARCFRGQQYSRGGTSFLIIAMLVSSMTARAGGEDRAAPMFSLNAFGTLGVVHSSEDRADFTSSIFKPNGAGYAHTWSNDVDSAIGAQVAAHFNSQLSATVQVISEQRYDNTYKPYVDWANLKYQITPDFSVRVGRTVLSTFLYSDSRDVGYSTLWVRQPTEVYNLIPILNSDGADVSYKVHFGTFTHTLLATYGGTKEKLPGGANSAARRQWNISDTMEYGALTLHVAYQQSALTLDSVRPFEAAFRSFGPQGVALADKYGSENKRLTLFSVGGVFDPGAWFIVGEWGRTQHHSVLGASSAWYVSSGFRFAKFTPYATLGGIRINTSTSDPGLDVAGLPPALAGLATGLNGVLNAYLGSAAIQDTVSAGIRWDFLNSADLKMQFDHTEHGAGSPGTLINVQPGFVPGGNVNIFTVAVDFVL